MPHFFTFDEVGNKYTVLKKIKIADILRITFYFCFYIN